MKSSKTRKEDILEGIRSLENIEIFRETASMAIASSDELIGQGAKHKQRSVENSMQEQIDALQEIIQELLQA